MSNSNASTTLPLRWSTPDGWATQALGDENALLNDHAYLEKKAASNALLLLNRWPEPNPPENWVVAMTSIARDEVEHLARVVQLIARRGGRLTRNHHNDYAADLHGLIRLGHGPDELIDRLMVSALIEARSCERFELLARACPDDELRRMYDELYASEAGHYRVFINLARTLATESVINDRWDAMLDAEAGIIQRQAPGSFMHSGLADSAAGRPD